MYDCYFKENVIFKNLEIIIVKIILTHFDIFISYYFNYHKIWEKRFNLIMQNKASYV